jgi:hypothetical protein
MKGMPPAFLYRFPWLGILAPGQPISVALMAIVWGVEPIVAADTLASYQRESLVIPIPGQPETWFLPEKIRTVAHYLLISHPVVNHVLPRLGIETTQAHRLLLVRLRQASPNNQDWNYWYAHPEVPASLHTYSQQALLWHLAEAGWLTELDALMIGAQEQGATLWPSQQRLGINPNHYQHTLEQAWRKSELQFEHHPSRSVEQQCRYALAQGLRHYSAQLIPALWVRSLLEAGDWDTTMGLAYLNALVEPQQRAIALQTLAPIVSADGVDALWKIAQQLHPDHAKTIAIKALISFLPVSSLREVMGLVASIGSDYYQAMALGAIAPHLTLPLKRQALALAMALSEESSRAYALRQLIPHLNRPLLQSLLSIIPTLKDPYEQALVWLAILPSQPSVQADLHIVLTQIESADERAEILCRLAAHNLDYWPAVIATIRDIGDEATRSLTLIHCSSAVPDESLPILWAIAMELQSERLRVNALLSLLHRICPEDCYLLLETSEHLESSEAKACLLSHLVPHLPQEHIPLVYGISRTLMPADQMEVLIALAQVHAGYVSNAEMAIARIVDPLAQLNARVALGPQSLENAMDVLGAIAIYPDHNCRANWLSQWAVDLPEMALEFALEIALNLESDPQRHLALTSLTDGLSLEQLRRSMDRLQQQHYPQAELINTAKQLRAYHLETPYRDAPSHSSLPLDHILIPITEEPSITTATLEAMFAMPDAYYRARALRGVLHELDWDNISASQWQLLLRMLALGDPLDLIQCLPQLMPGALALAGSMPLGKVAAHVWVLTEGVARLQPCTT